MQRTLEINGRLSFANRGWRFEGHTEDNGLAIGDPSLNSSAIVGQRTKDRAVVGLIISI
jgi:hypothetical protein